MNAKDLHEHVSQWPDAALPRCSPTFGEPFATQARLRFWPGNEECGPWWSWRAPPRDGSNDFWCGCVDPESAHVASGLERLAITHHSVQIWHGVEWEVVARTFKGDEEHNGAGPTLFHAIHAAILATKESA